MISWIVFKGFLRKEFKQALRDPRMRVVLFIAPAIQLIIFGVALSTDVKNIRLWTKIDSNDYILQHIYDRSIASGWFLPVPLDNNADPYRLLKAGKIDAALFPPPRGLTYETGRGTAPLQLLIDATNVIQAQSVESYIKSISDKVGKEDLGIEIKDPPIKFALRVLFNPSLETSYFMIPGVLCILMCITSVLLTSLSITREKEMGTFEMLISAPVSSSEIISGKTIPYVILGMINVPLILIIAILLFNVPMRGSFLVLMGASLIFICAAVAIGVLISTLAQNQQQAMLGGFLFLFPAILLSGMLFPIENMPDSLKWLSYIDPLSHFLALIRNILLKGGETQFILERVGILLLMAIVFTILSYKRFHTTLE